MAKAENISTGSESEWETKAEPFADTWDFDKNSVLIGTFLSRRVVEQDDLNNPGQKRDANVYTIQAADDGEKYSVWGTWAIDEAFKTIEPGTLCRFEYQGKADLDGGRTVRKFLIQTKK